jgi:hypothetical protein
MASKIHRASRGAVIVLPLIAVLAVVSGYFQAPQPDEGSSAHIFQLSVVLLAPMIPIFLSTADWTRPWRNVQVLVFPAATLIVAFAALYYLEHYYYLAHYR